MILANYFASMATSGADTITGLDTADTITGGLGDDSLSGGGNNDTYVYTRGDGADVISEGANGGATDRIVLHGVTQAQVSFTGSGSSTTLVFAESAPGAGDGGSIRIGSLNDYYGQGIEQVVFDDGSTWSKAMILANYFTGAATSGADTIVGFNTADTISGGGGSDVLTGGPGNDLFVYVSLSDAPISATPEKITDFAQGADRIDLSSIDADSLTPGDQLFSWIGNAAFSNVAGQLKYANSPSGARTIFGDVDGDGIADFQIQVTGTTNFTAADFAL